MPHTQKNWPSADELPGIHNPQNLRWMRQKGESWQAYEAFSVYRDIGQTRTLGKAAEKVGKTQSLIDRWSARWSWIDRVASFDANEDWERMVRMREERHELFRKDLDIAGLVLRKLWERLNELDPDKLSWSQWNRAWDTASKNARLAFGQTGESADASPRVSDPEAEAAWAAAVENDPELLDAAALLNAAARRSGQEG